MSRQFNAVAGEAESVPVDRAGKKAPEREASAGPDSMGNLKVKRQMAMELIAMGFSRGAAARVLHMEDSPSIGKKNASEVNE